MKPNKRWLRFLFSLLLLLVFIGGVYLSVYIRGNTARNVGAANHSPSTSPLNIYSSATAKRTGGLKDQRRLAALTKTMQRAREIGMSLNAAMEFYGRVIDQYGKPVPGVIATLKYNYFSAVVLSAYDAHNAVEKRVTDQNGEFCFSGKEGISLSVRLEPLSGFEFGNSGYWSRNFSIERDSRIKLPPATKEKPFIFPAYRLGRPAAVQDGFLQEFLVPDERPYQIRLAEKKIAETGSGDLRISVWQKGVEYKKGASWGIRIQGNNLQVQPTEDLFLYWAPTDGYQSTWDFSWTDEVKGYSDARDFKFWVRQGSFYGSLKVECRAFFKNEFRLIIRSSLGKQPGDPNLQPLLPDWPPKDPTLKQ